MNDIPTPVLITRFDIGDRIWCIKNNRVNWCEVYEIRAVQRLKSPLPSNGVVTTITYCVKTVDRSASAFECELRPEQCFATKEALLAFL